MSLFDLRLLEAENADHPAGNTIGGSLHRLRLVELRRRRARLGLLGPVGEELGEGLPWQPRAQGRGRVHLHDQVLPGAQRPSPHQPGVDVDLADPAIDIVSCVDAVAPALEIIDSRYRDFRFSLADVRRACAALPAPRPGVAPPGARPAAVLVPIFETAGEARVVLTKRPETMPSHQGEIAFPGGKFEPGVDGSLRDAARRARLCSVRRNSFPGCALPAKPRRLC